MAISSISRMASCRQAVYIISKKSGNSLGWSGGQTLQTHRELWSSGSLGADVVLFSLLNRKHYRTCQAQYFILKTKWLLFLNAYQVILSDFLSSFACSSRTKIEQMANGSSTAQTGRGLAPGLTDNIGSPFCGASAALPLPVWTWPHIQCHLKINK